MGPPFLMVGGFGCQKTMAFEEVEKRDGSESLQRSKRTACWILECISFPNSPSA